MINKKISLISKQDVVKQLATIELLCEETIHNFLTISFNENIHLLVNNITTYINIDLYKLMDFTDRIDLSDGELLSEYNERYCMGLGLKENPDELFVIPPKTLVFNKYNITSDLNHQIQISAHIIKHILVYANGGWDKNKLLIKILHNFRNDLTTKGYEDLKLTTDKDLKFKFYISK